MFFAANCYPVKKIEKNAYADNFAKIGSKIDGQITKLANYYISQVLGEAIN